MEPGCTLSEAPPNQFDDIIALEITEVSPDLVVLQLKEETLEECIGEVYRDSGTPSEAYRDSGTPGEAYRDSGTPGEAYRDSGGEHVPMFSWTALQKQDCSTQWIPPGASPVQGLISGQFGDDCGMAVNSMSEEMSVTYTVPETCFGNLELEFYPCDICEASFTDEQELERHVSDSHFISGAKQNERKRKAPSLMCEDGAAPGQSSFPLGFSQSKMPTRKTRYFTPRQCALCGRIFKQQKSFRRHRHHTWRQGPSNGASAVMQQPVKTRTLNWCPETGRKSKEQRSMQPAFHGDRHHLDLLKNINPLKCCECDRHFDTKDTFYKHQCFHLRKQLRAFNATGRKNQGVNFYHCQLCALPFTGGLEFEHHVKVTHPEQYEKVTRRRITEQQDSESVPLSHSCPETEKSFHTHQFETRVHKDKKRYGHHECLKCKKIFRTRRALQRHKWAHLKKTVLKCCECSRCFGTAETFYKHQCFHLRKQLRAFIATGRKNQGVNFYHCQLCALPFTGGLEFEHHVKVTHPEQYEKVTRTKCSAGKTRSRKSRKSALKDRGKTVSLENAEAGCPSKTVEPEKRTAIAEQRDSETVQLSHPCPECEKSFHTQAMLNRHQKMNHFKEETRMHKDEKRYAHHECPQCEKICRTRTALQKHKMGHIKVFKCCECIRSRCYLTAESFYKHQCFHLCKQLRDFNASGRKNRGVNFYHCQLCALPFTGGLEFEHHVKVTHPEQYEKTTITTCSAEKTTKTKESGAGNNGKAISKPFSVAEVHVKITSEEHKVADQCSQTDVTSGSCTMAVKTENQESAISDPLHQCHKCGRIFRVRKMLDKHMRIYHQDQSKVLHRGRSHPATNLLRCCECDRHFSTRESFKRHQCFHLRKQLRAFNASGRKTKGVNFYHCQLCALQFTEALNFELHVKVTHPEQYKKAAKNKHSAVKTS